MPKFLQIKIQSLATGCFAIGAVSCLAIFKEQTMSKLTKQDIQDIANGYTVKYVSNSFTKDELIIELAQLCLKAIDEKEELLSQLDELDEEE
jgi:hypothetical protein